MRPIQAAGSIIDLTLDDDVDLNASPAHGSRLCKGKIKALQLADPTEVIEIFTQHTTVSKKRTRSTSSSSPAPTDTYKRIKSIHKPAAGEVFEISDDEECDKQTNCSITAASSEAGPSRVINHLHTSASASSSGPYALLDLTFSQPKLDDEDYSRQIENELNVDGCDNHAADLELAERLAEEERRQYIEGLPKNRRDEALARRLEKAEQREQEKLLKSINSRKVHPVSILRALPDFPSVFITGPL